MRVTTELWASALLRRNASAGGFGAIVRRGANEAGAAFVVVRDRLGEVTLYGPAPQASYGEARPDERWFSELMRSTDESAISARLEREMRFDSDVWIVEIEPGKLELRELLTLAGE